MLTLRTVVTAWNQVQAGARAIRAGEAEVRAAELALRGYQLEYADGLHSTSDLLIADQNLRAAQVALSGNRHDTIVAEASLLASVERLEARTLLPDMTRPRARLWLGTP